MTTRKRKNKTSRKIILVCSSGGHFSQLYSLKRFWKLFERRVWVTFNSIDAKTVLEDEKTFWAFSPTNRNLINLVRNILLAFIILKKEKPDLLITTGAGVSVPFIYIAKCFRIETVYIESLSRFKELSLSAKIVYPIVGTLLVQWPQLALKYRKAQYRGTVI